METSLTNSDRYLFPTFLDDRKVYNLAAAWWRSGVLTDAELCELRYGGRPAALLRSLKAVGVVRFDKSDVVRHPLVSEIIHAYETAARPNAKITEEASRPPGGEAEHASNGQRQ